MAGDLLDILNPQQRQAVTAGDGPVLVLAGPGSGKTRVLTYRIAYLIRERGIPPYNLLAVTFTNKAAGEMRERVEGLLGGRLDGLTIGTFHAICAKLLRVEADRTPFGRDYAIYDTDEQASVVKGVMSQLNIDMKRFKPGAVLNAISQAKNELILPNDMPRNDYFGEIVARVYPLYQQALVNSGAMDFDDLLMQTVLLLRDDEVVREKYQRRFAYVLVDEFQDTNTAQYELVRLFGAPQLNIFVVGDEDQGIYAFRGADYRNVMAFRRDYPGAEVVLLEQNYRSTQNVLDVARAVIDKNTKRTPKHLFTDRGEGPKVIVQEVYTEADEAQFAAETIRSLMRSDGYSFRDFAIMYRTNAQSRPFEDACVQYNLPYKLVGGVGFYKRREVRDLVAYLRVINNPNESVSFDRIVNVPGRGIGDKTLAAFKMWAADQGWSVARALSEIAGGAAVPFSGRAAKAFAEFARQIEAWQAFVEVEGSTLEALFDDITGQIGYAAYLREISDTPEENEERMQNLAQLRAVMKEKSHLSLRDFLEETALVAEIDSLDATKNGVTLLTLHAAKGLEYPVVLITGVEDGLLPHSRSITEPEAMAEERRLLYVGVTRARERLYLTYAFRRSLYGDSMLAEPSRFLGDIPAALTEGNWFRVKKMRDQTALEQATRWEREPNNVISFEQKLRDMQASPRDRSKAPPPRPTPTLKYPPGVRVFHAKFGEGVVLNSTRVGDDEEVDVQFAQAGRRVLSASFANLVLLGR
ncbi:MAG: UvrD-helicase domain-containing protein [Anaerolineae bacterium]|nr:UvrD-helicase domain-containing protein [Anaerolineae bacterium]